MSRLITPLAVCAIAAGAFGQSFECYLPGTFPADSSMSCEGVNSNNLGSTLVPPTGVSALANCGFPTAGGTQYANLRCNGPIPLLSPGGPFPWPPAANVTEMRTPIPAGAGAVSFDWEYFNAEGLGSSFNDGFAVAVMSGSGTLVAQLMYVDNSTGPLDVCSAGAGAGTALLPAGPQTFAGALPALAGCEYLSFVAWNEGDNAVAGSAHVDNILFDAGVIGCLPPCYLPSPPAPSLAWSSPSGPGCVFVSMGGLPPGGTYYLAVTFNPPPGWFFGININLQELADQINFGYPFVGPLTPDVACVGGGGAATIGEFCGLPSGLTIYSVALGLNGVGTGQPVTVGEVTPANTYTIP
jgi:hypothetical protein